MSAVILSTSTFTCLTDSSHLDNLICHDGGMDNSDIFIRKQESPEAGIEYIFPSISLIPPYDDGCYVKLFYNGNILEDTIYISKDVQILSNSKKWKIDARRPYQENFYQFSMSEYSEQYETKGRIYIPLISC